MRAALVFLTFAAGLAAQPAASLLPQCSGADRELALRAHFALCHSSRFKTPVWTAHELTADLMTASPSARPRRFRADHALAQPGATDEDYRYSGFERGHLVPASDLAGDAAALRDTFLLSNAAPQTPALNRGLWHALEYAVRVAAAQNGHAVIFTGPIYCVEVQWIGNVGVPCAFFKVIVTAGVRAYIMPNQSEKLTGTIADYAVAIDEVERRTGLRFPIH